VSGRAPARMKAGEKLDLHTHSDRSDGTLPPAQVAREAARRGVRLWALTDHDTVSGLNEAAAEASSLGIAFIGGVEISTRQHDYLHILGLGVNHRDKRFLQTLEEAASRRDARIRRVTEQLAAAGVDISYAEIRGLARGSLSRAHIADLLKSKGYASSRSDAFRKYLDPGKPGYAPSGGLDACEAIAAITNAGGAAVVAHPGLVLPVLELPAWKTAGLAGLEVFYPSHSADMTRKLLEMAVKYGFFATAGSDYHGPDSGRTASLGAPLPEKLRDEVAASVEKFVWNS